MAERGEYQLYIARATEQALSQPFYFEGKPVFADPIPDPQHILDYLISTRLLADHLKQLDKVPTAKDFEKADTNHHIGARVKLLRSMVHEGVALRIYANYLAHATDGQFVVIPGSINDDLTRGFDHLRFETDPTQENARRYRQPRRWTPDAVIADRSQNLLVGAVEITRKGTQDYCDGKDNKLATNAELYAPGFIEDPCCQFVVPIDSSLPVTEERLFKTPYEEAETYQFALRAARAQSAIGLPSKQRRKERAQRRWRPAYSH